MSIPVIVSITTLPSRIGLIQPCLDSLFAGDVVPDKILLPLPKFSKRENCAYNIPTFLKELYSPTVEIVEVEADWGPGTKVLGALKRLPEPCYLVAADDDVRYHPRFLSGLLAAQCHDHTASFSYHTYRTGGLTIGQGCDGFSFYSPNLHGIDAFYRAHISGTDLFYHDDLWLSFFLFGQGIAVKRLAPAKGAGPVYEIIHHTNPLNKLTGNLARKHLNRQGLRRLLLATKPGLRKKYGLKAVAVFDGLITSPVRRLKRKAAQLKHSDRH